MKNKFKTYRSLTKNFIYISNSEKCGSAEYREVQIYKYNISGTNQNDCNPSETVYEIALTDGYKFLKIDIIKDLKNAKDQALKMLVA